MISNVCRIIISLHFLAWIHQFLFLAWNGLKCDWLFKKNEPGTIKTSNQSKVDNIEKKITELWLWATKASALNEWGNNKSQQSTPLVACELEIVFFDITTHGKYLMFPLFYLTKLIIHQSCSSHDLSISSSFVKHRQLILAFTVCESYTFHIVI